MGNFIFEKSRIDGIYTIIPDIFGDRRGYFMETYRREEFAVAGIDTDFVQDNQSKSRFGVLRGLHFQKKWQQAKLVRVISGEVFDVAVDLRRGSSTYGKWEGVLLSAENRKQFFIPRGFAHGFLVLSEETEFVYKCDEYYHPEDEGGVRWDDPEIGVEWPISADMELLLSEKDKSYAPLQEQKIML